jgi:hypothetical protein
MSKGTSEEPFRLGAACGTRRRESEDRWAWTNCRGRASGFKVPISSTRWEFKVWRAKFDDELIVTYGYLDA